MNNIVLFLSDSLSLGGAERQLHLLASSLTESWKPILIALTNGPMLEWYKKDSIQVIMIQRKYRFNGLSPFFRIQKLISDLQPSIVHSWGWMSTLAASHALRRTSIPHVSSMIRSGSKPKRRKYLALYSARLGDVIIANSMAGILAWKPPVLKSRVIYNGFDWARITNNPRNLMNSTNPIAIIMNATMSDKKDWIQFINTVRYFAENYPETKVVFNGYGNGPERNVLLLTADDLINSGLLNLPGRTSEPIKECCRSDVGVLLSTFGEGISNSIIEYMACGLPVICTRSGGNSELVINRVTGFLVDPDNPPKQIAEKIIWLIDNPDKAKAMGKAGKDRIKKLFSIEKMVEAYISIYEELLP